MWEVLKSAKDVADKSRHVQVDKEALVSLARKFLENDVKVPLWNCSYHLSGKVDDLITYLLVLDTINFCFWAESGKHKWEIDYKSKKLSGYYALAVSLKIAFETGLPITKAEYLAELSLQKLKDILGGRGDLQLLENRLSALNELGQILLSDYGGKARNLVEASGKSAVRLARLLAEKLSSFQDVSEYFGIKVSFYKRAQILVADLYGALTGKKWGGFVDMDKLTCFADYKLPQVLRHFEVLRYKQSLAKKVDQKTLLDAGSPEEVEIRACTI